MRRLLPNNELLALYIPTIVIAVFSKWVMIHYGLPYSTHVDEMAIITDPFKIIQMYFDGDFSSSTNLFNWICLGWYGLIFLVGWLLHYWTNVEDFKTFLISGSADFLLLGRVFSALLSLIGTLVLIKLIHRLKTDFSLKALSAGLIVFNPFELNATNWVKFDALSYLGYAVIIYMAYVYFVEDRLEYRARLYILLFIGLSIRIEIIAFLIGIFIYDVFFFRPTTSNIPFKALSYGIALYFLITLAPVSFLFRLFSPVTSNLVVTPTFYDAIVTKIPGFGEMFRIVGESGYYFECLVALLGPVIVFDLFRSWKVKEVYFLYLPLAIMLGVLFIFPIKNVHYLLGVSVILLVAYVYCITRSNFERWRLASLMISFSWVLSYSLQLIFLIFLKGDVRISARDYTLRHTRQGELIYAEGIFAAINDTPDRYTLKSEASKLIGGTGLSNEYLAHHIDPAESRVMVSVSAWDPFKGTLYENVFNNFYDSVKLKRDRPSYYIYVAPSFWQLLYSQNPFYEKYNPYYHFLSTHYKQEIFFSYNIIDPRLHFTNTYYFRPVIVSRKNGDW